MQTSRLRWPWLPLLALGGLVACEAPTQPQGPEEEREPIESQEEAVVSAGCGTGFTDVVYTYGGTLPGEAIDDIQCLACAGVVGGYADGTFRPNNTVTRGQFAKMLSNGAGFWDPVSGQTFQDVPPSDTFYPYVQRLAARGIMGGYPCDNVGLPCVAPGNLPYFLPGNNVTHGQAMKMITNAANLGAEDVSGMAQIFNDVPPQSTFYAYIQRAYHHGITRGWKTAANPYNPPVVEVENPPYYYHTRWFRPGDPALRGDIAMWIARAFFNAGQLQWVGSLPNYPNQIVGNQVCSTGRPVRSLILDRTRTDTVNATCSAGGVTNPVPAANNAPRAGWYLYVRPGFAGIVGNHTGIAHYTGTTWDQSFSVGLSRSLNTIEYQELCGVHDNWRFYFAIHPGPAFTQQLGYVENTPEWDDRLRKDLAAVGAAFASIPYGGYEPVPLGGNGDYNCDVTSAYYLLALGVDPYTGASSGWVRWQTSYTVPEYALDNVDFGGLTAGFNLASRSLMTGYANPVRDIFSGAPTSPMVVPITEPLCPDFGGCVAP